MGVESDRGGEREKGCRDKEERELVTNLWESWRRDTSLQEMSKSEKSNRAEVTVIDTAFVMQ